jgi:hypothetical protein
MASVVFFWRESMGVSAEENVLGRNSLLYGPLVVG